MTEGSAPFPDAELLALLPCGVVVTDTKGVLLRVNQTFCTWLGCTPGELVRRRKLQDFFTIGGRIFHQTHWLPSLQMQGSLAEVKFEVRRDDGVLLPMMVNAVRRKQGEAYFDIVTLTVAEERNKYERELLAARKRADELVQAARAGQLVLEVAQARLRQAMQVAAICLWDVDPATLTRRYEPEVARLLGAPPRELAEADFLGAIDPRDARAEAAAFSEALNDASVTHSWTHRLLGLDGVERVVIAAGQAIRHQDGSLLRFGGVLRDVTEATRLRENAEDRALLAEQMVGIVSHDLRNPLTAILMGARLLDQGDRVPPPKRRKVVSNMLSSVGSAQRLVEDLLDFTMARVGSGLTVVRRPVDFHEVVAHAVDNLMLAFPGRDLQHVALGTGDCLADADRVAQLLGNLVGNALAYGRADTPVTVSSEITAVMVRLAVHNAGTPIPPGMWTTMFEPMVRGKPSAFSTRSVGLGLYIVRAIATAHEGKVEVVSTAEAGTTFIVSFARMPAEPKAASGL